MGNSPSLTEGIKNVATKALNQEANESKHWNSIFVDKLKASYNRRSSQQSAYFSSDEEDVETCVYQSGDVDVYSSCMDLSLNDGVNKIKSYQLEHEEEKHDVEKDSELDYMEGAGNGLQSSSDDSEDSEGEGFALYEKAMSVDSLDVDFFLERKVGKRKKRCFDKPIHSVPEDLNTIQDYEKPYSLKESAVFRSDEDSFYLHGLFPETTLPVFIKPDKESSTESSCDDNRDESSRNVPGSQYDFQDSLDIDVTEGKLRPHQTPALMKQSAVEFENPQDSLEIDNEPPGDSRKLACDEKTDSNPPSQYGDVLVSPDKTEFHSGELSVTEPVAELNSLKSEPDTPLSPSFHDSLDFDSLISAGSEQVLQKHACYSDVIFDSLDIDEPVVDNSPKTTSERGVIKDWSYKIDKYSVCDKDGCNTATGIHTNAIRTSPTANGSQRVKKSSLKEGKKAVGVKQTPSSSTALLPLTQKQVRCRPQLHVVQNSFDMKVVVTPEFEAKLKSSLSWILYKAYRDSIPAEIKDPFYETDQGTLQIKPHLVRILASSEVYCQACANMFPNTATQWQGHWSIIQVLSRKGIYVTGSDDTAVTETVLMKTAPFNADGHLALISALMLAYTCETVTVERVVQAVRRVTTFNASSELPSGVEDTVKFWINKICSVAVSRDTKSQQMLQGETNQKVRIVSRTPVPCATPAPVLNNVIEDITDGCSLAVLISFYCPNMLNFGDICLKENLGIADSLYNLRLVKTFCERNLPTGSFSFSYEDLLYTPLTLKENIFAFIAELFYWFEIQKSEGSRSSSAAQALSGVPAVSNATKRSFQKTEDSRFTSNPELHKSGASPSVPSRQGPLLHKRHVGKTGVNEEPVQYLEPPRHPRRALSLSSPQERDVIRQSVIAWQEPEDPQSHRPTSRTSQVKQSQESHNSALLANVSIDSELCESFADDQLGSINFDSDISQSPQPTLGDRQNVPSNLRDPNHPEYMEVESVNSHQSNVNSARSDKLEPLMPAILRPAKEKVTNHTKAQERGEPDLRKKTSPTKPRKSRSPPVNGVSTSQGDVVVEAVVTLPLDSTQVTSSDETIVTPLPDDQLSARSGSGDDYPARSGSTEGDSDPQRKGFEAFYINPDISVEVSLPPVSSQSPRALSVGSAHSDTSEVAASYTIDQAHTMDTARAAGIPVVQSSDPAQIRRTTSRDGSVSSSRSSGDFSDHESHKIHLDHKVRETNALSLQAQSRQSPDTGETHKPKLVISDQLPKTLTQTLADKEKRPQTTNFAEIKRIKDTFGNIDNSGFVYMQNGQDQKDSAKAAALKSSFLRKQGDSGGKKTTFATLPNETTWSAQRAASSQAQAQSNGTDSSSQPVSTELSQLRLKLDEKRKEIERKKQRMELQQQKMRQRLGKAAFMRVVSRHMDDSPDGPKPETTHEEHSAAEIEERLGQNMLESHDVHRPTSLVDGSQRSKPFSREGIQQTIDNVRKKWFREDDLLGGARHPDEDLMSSSLEERPGPVPPVQPGALPPHPMTDSQHSSSSQHSSGSQPDSYEAYDYSLDKLNKSLTDLQGEIARLSLQQEQIKFLQSPQGYTQGGSIAQVPSVPPQALPKQIGYTSPHHQEGQGEPHQPHLLQGGQIIQSQFRPIPGSNQGYAPDKTEVFRVKPELYHPMPHTVSTQQAPFSTPIMSATSYQPHPPSHQTPVYQAASAGSHGVPSSTQSFAPPTSVPSAARHTERNIPTPPGYTLPPHSPDAVHNAGDTASEDSSTTQESAASGNGFFVAFGDETPKRPKPKLGKDRVKKEARTETSPPQAPSPAAATSVATPAASDPAPTSHQTPQTGGFVIEDREITPDKYTDEEMARKKEKIRQMQMKRKEEQERKRLEKEQETAKQRDAQRIKQEEAERKKAEEKARREQIYQQYLMRKQQQEDEENGVERPPERPAKSKPRPKSMFVKATESPPRHDDEGLLCSQDDLSARAFVIPSTGGAATAFSCNTLTQNGRPGGATFRRPPSPDLYRLRHGNRSNDSSETGSNAGSDYTGPKLFVKPSSKSNRHIIVNAISHCCLAGIVNTETKNKVLEIIAQSDSKHFLILFRDGGCQFKGLYTYAPESEDIFKIYGVGPRQITNKMAEKFYKYNSGAKSFTEVKSTKHISVSIDAVVIHNVLWKTGKSSAAAASARK